LFIISKPPGWNVFFSAKATSSTTEASHNLNQHKAQEATTNKTQFNDSQDQLAGRSRFQLIKESIATFSNGNKGIFSVLIFNERIFCIVVVVAASFN